MKPARDYINLLPLEEKRSYSVVSGKGLIIGIVFTLLWLGLFGWQMQQQMHLKTTLSSLLAQKKALEQQTDAELKERGFVARSASAEKTALVRTILGKRVRWSEVFRQFSQVVPPGLWFDSLEGNTGDRIEVKVRGGALTYTAVSTFMLSLEKTGYFKNPRLSYARQVTVRGRDVVSFEIISGIAKTQGVQ